MTFISEKLIKLSEILFFYSLYFGAQISTSNLSSRNIFPKFKFDYELDGVKLHAAKRISSDKI